MGKNVLIPQDIAEKAKEYLLERGYHLTVGYGLSQEELEAAIPEFDALIVRNANKYTAKTIDAAKKLKVIARHGTGVDHIDVPYAAKNGIWVVNGPLANINAVAEHTIGFLLALSCQLLESDRQMRKNNWAYRETLMRHDVKGKVLGLVGLGRIGSLVAKKAHFGLDMKILAYSPSLTAETAPEWIQVAKSVDEVLEASDYLSLHVPSTPQTRGMIGAKELARMKPAAYLINCARGDVCDEAALYEALKAHTIAGAALDVFCTDPLVQDSPLKMLDNVILTPHSAALSEEGLYNMGYYAALGVDEVLSGKVPTFAVNHPENPRQPLLRQE